MSTERITNGEVTMEIESYPNSNIVTISIDDPTNLCMDNDYNGDHAGIELNLDDVRKLHAHLTKLLNEREQS